MLCGPHCSQLSTILNSIVTPDQSPDSGSTILFNIVDKCEQCWPHNIFNHVKQQAHNFYTVACEFSQLSCPGQTRTGVARELTRLDITTCVAKTLIKI